MRRVVITGLGLVSPLGCGYETTWKRLTAGHNAARRIETFDVSDLTCQIACQVPRGDGSNGSFNPSDWMEPKEQRKVDEFIIYAMGAATQALTDAGWKPTAYEDQIRTGVLIGSGIGGLQGIEKFPLLFAERARAGTPVLHSRAPDQSRRRLCLHRHGLNSSEPRRRHRLLDRRRMPSATPRASLPSAMPRDACRRQIAGPGWQSRLAACRALSTNFNDRPQRASRPYDRDQRQLRHRGREPRRRARRASTPRQEHTDLCRVIGYRLSATPSTSPRPPRTETAPVVP